MKLPDVGMCHLRLLVLTLVVPLLGALSVSAAPPAPRIALRWNSLPDLPNPVGVAGPFVGVFNDALIVAGGANFPEAPPWRGGKKTWHDAVYVLRKTSD